MPRPLRVLHALHDYLPRHQAGSEIYVADLCAAQRRAGLQPTVVAAEFDPARAHGQLTWRSHDGVPVAEVVNTWQFDQLRRQLCAIRRWRRPSGHVLDIVQPHVLHVHNLLNLSFELPALARARGIAVAATLHDYTLVCPSGGQRVHRAESHVCHVIEPSAVRALFSSLAVSRAAAIRPALAPRAGARARAGWPRRMRRVAPRADHGRRRGAGAHGGRRHRRRRDRTATRRGPAGLCRFRRRGRAVGLAGARVRGARSAVRRGGRLGLRICPAGPAPRDGQTLTAACAIGFVGTLVWHKGADVLIDAVAQLPPRPGGRPHLRRPGCLPRLRRHAAAAGPWTARAVHGPVRRTRGRGHLRADGRAGRRLPLAGELAAGDPRGLHGRRARDRHRHRRHRGLAGPRTARHPGAARRPRRAGRRARARSSRRRRDSSEIARSAAARQVHRTGRRRVGGNATPPSLGADDVAAVTRS